MMTAMELQLGHILTAIQKTVLHDAITLPLREFAGAASLK